MTAPVFPAFIRLEAKGTDQGKADFLRAVDQAMSAGETRTADFAATSQANIDKALRVPPGAASTFTAEIDRMAVMASAKLESFATTARRNLDAALSGKITANGGVDLDVSGAREAAAIAERRAVIARQLADATKASALAERDFSQATRLSIAASKELASAETQAAATARIQAEAVEKLQLAMDRAGVSARGLSNANDNARVSAGQFRAGTQQLGFQISDLGVQLAMAGASANTGKMALMAFSQQVPQIVQAIGLMRGTAGGFIGFMGGPWGATLLAAGSILGTLALAHHDAAGASDAHKDAAADLTKALDDLHDATVRESRSTQASIQGDIDKANAMRARAVETRKAAIAQLEATKATLNATRDGVFTGQAGPAAGLAIQSYGNRASELDAQIKAQNAAIAKADEVVRLKRGAQIRQGVAEAFDPAAAATGRYERTLDRLNSQLQEGKISEAAYRAELTRATEARNAATEATRKGSKASGERTRAAREEKAANDALERSFYAGMRAAEAFNAELAKAMGKQLETDTGRYWDGVAKRQATALDKLTATAQAQAEWNDHLADTVRMLDQIAGSGRALGDIGRVLGALSGGNLGALPGSAGIIGQAIGGITWQTIDADGSRIVHQLGDEFAQVLDRVFGGNGTFAQTLQSAGIGAAAGSLAFGGGNSAIGSSIGGVLGDVAGKALGKSIGGTIGKALGPLGSIAGGLLGGALGGLFKTVKSGYAQVRNGDVVGTYGRTGDLQTGAASVASGLVAQISSIARTLNTRLGAYDFDIGRKDDKFVVNTGARGVFNFDSEAQAIEFAVREAVADGAFIGLSDGAKRLIENGGALQDQIAKAVSFQGVFRDLKAYNDPLGAAIDDLNSEFSGLIDIFKEAGASAMEFANLEELYGKRRAEAVEDANSRILGSLKSLKSSLEIGSSIYSLRDRQSSALAAFNPLRDRVAAGDSTAFDAFAEASQTLLDLERQIYGSTSQFYARADEIRALTDQAIVGKTAISDAATASDSPFTALTSQQQATTSAIDSQTQALLGALGAINDNLVTSIRAQLSAAVANGSTALAIPERGYF